MSKSLNAEMFGALWFNQVLHGEARGNTHWFNLVENPHEGVTLS